MARNRRIDRDTKEYQIADGVWEDTFKRIISVYEGIGLRMIKDDFYVTDNDAWEAYKALSDSGKEEAIAKRLGEAP